MQVVGRRIKWVTALVACALISAVGAQVASAHTLYNFNARVYESPGLCVTENIALDHGAGGGHVYGGVVADRDASYGILNAGFSVPCAVGRTMSKGYFAADMQYLFWGAYANQWTLCSETGWTFNTSATHNFQPQWEMTYSDINGRHAPCGDGYYYVWIGQFANDGGWQPIADDAWINFGPTGWHWFTWWN